MAHGPVVHQNFSSKTMLNMKTILAAYLMLCIKVFLSRYGLEITFYIWQETVALINVRLYFSVSWLLARSSRRISRAGINRPDRDDTIHVCEEM